MAQPGAGPFGPEGVDRPGRMDRPERGERPDREARRQQILERFDADGDGTLSQEERAAAREASMKR